ncbi:hypothetical protein [Actinomadura sp. B10D3]|uniref:hypothetical protein n=1 Tax=Actinomadura sp. B10D3 TaxID=3153557 RepID=UPI00325F7CCE
MLSVLAELQRELVIANTLDGLAAARARGRIGGRRPRLTPEQAALAQELYDARVKTVQQIADLFGVPHSNRLRPTSTKTPPCRASRRRPRPRRRPSIPLRTTSERRTAVTPPGPAC